MIPRGTKVFDFSAAQDCSLKEQRKEDPLLVVSTTTLQLSFTVKPHWKEDHNLKVDKMQHGHPYLCKAGNVQ